MGYRGNYTCTLDWPLIARLYAAGNGTKAIAKIAGGNQASIREGLIKRGLYQFGQNRKANQFGPWHGYVQAEITPQIEQERQHQAWWREAYPTPKRDKKAEALAYYYAHHEENKQRQAARAKARHALIKDTPAYKAKAFARNQLARIKRQVKLNQKSRRTHEYLGCTYAQAAQHITAQLPPEWTWQNYGKAWEIDHRIQLSDGSLLDQAHMNRVCHYTNLRPMAVRDNRSRPRGAYGGSQAVA